MSEMWKRKQKHEVARKMYWTKISVKEFQQMGKALSGRS